MNQEQAAFAARWWANKLRERPEHKILGPREHHPPTDMTVLLMGILWKPTPEEKVVEFQQALEGRLLKRSHRSIDVDYDPCDVLCDAAQAVGLKIAHKLPSKTRMYIYNTHIEVAEGYRAPSVVVWGEAPPAEDS